MAIYHCSVKVIMRSKGQRVTSAAAYRAAQKIYDWRTGRRFNYSKKQGVSHTEILAPRDAPKWVHDRSELWNSVERKEKRKDAQLAREFELALPHELSRQDRMDLALGFVRTELVARGMVADVCFHDPVPGRNHDHNFHVHVLCTMRRLEGNRFGPKVREWNSKALLLHWRKAWSVAVNNALEKAQKEARVSHLSYSERGIPLTPAPKLGPARAAAIRAKRKSQSPLGLTWWMRRRLIAYIEWHRLRQQEQTVFEHPCDTPGVQPDYDELDDQSPSMT